MEKGKKVALSTTLNLHSFETFIYFAKFQLSVFNRSACCSARQQNSEDAADAFLFFVCLAVDTVTSVSEASNVLLVYSSPIEFKL